MTTAAKSRTTKKNEKKDQPYLMVRMTAEEKAEVEKAAERRGHRYPAGWARSVLLTEARRILG